jgi:D-3-phosphoglycerate dehydrogenase
VTDRNRFLLVSTSDRYDLEWERATLASVKGLTLELRHGTPKDEATLLELARDADALLITSRERLSRATIAALRSCKVISRYAVGLDHIDLEAASEHGVVVTHFPDYCTAEVADHTLGLMLALNRRILELDREIRDGAWVRNAHHTDQVLRGPIPPLRESTLGLVGIGRIGTAVARRAASFGMTILAADPYLTDDDIRARGAEAMPFGDLLRLSDIVSLHCPLTAETHGLIGASEVAQMRHGALLVNTARGHIIDLDALVGALRQGRLAGAALDVVYPEPLPLDSPLLELDNVILTPHSAYYSERSVETVRTETLLAAIDVLRGVRPRVVANPTVLERVSLRPS